MKKITFLFLIFIFITITKVNSQTTLIYNDPNNYNNYGNDVIVDNSGNVYVTGYTNNTNAIYGYTREMITMKYPVNAASNTPPDWLKYYPTSPAISSEGVKITVDNNGNVYALCAGHGPRMTIVKYDPNGNEIWATVIIGIIGPHEPIPVAIAVDDTRQLVYAIGYMEGFIGYGDEGILALARCSMSNGTLLLHHDIVQQSKINPRDMVIDNNGDVYITGLLNQYTNTSNFNYATIKFAGIANATPCQYPNGCLIPSWTKYFDGPSQGADSAASMAIDNVNNFIYVTGTSENDFLTLKYDLNGNLLGSSRYINSGNDYAVKVIVNSCDQSVYVTGMSNGGATNEDIVTIKYPGSFNWAANPPPLSNFVKRFARSNGAGIDIPKDMTFSTDGYLYVTGHSQNLTDLTSDYVTLKYTNDLDPVNETFYYQSPNVGTDISSSIAAGLNGKVVITGNSYGGATALSDIATIIYPANNVSVSPAPKDYSTLADAFTAINNGVHGSGAITVNINSSTLETTTPTLNSLVFSSCTITPTANVTVSPSSCITNLSALMFLNGADNVTVDGNIGGTRSLTLKGEGKVINCIKLENGAKDNIFQNIITENPTEVNIKLSLPASTGNNNNRIENCVIKGGTKGISITGSSAFTNDENKVFKNTVNECSASGISIQGYTLNTQVNGNKIFNTDPLVPVASASFTAIGFYGNGNSMISPNSISQNKIYDMYFTNSLTEITGIDINPSNNTTTTLDINNNFISLNKDFPFATTVNGIKTFDINITDFNEKIYYNSIFIGGSNSLSSCKSYGIKYDPTSPFPSTVIYNQINNISVNERTGGTINLASFILHPGGLNLVVDYNCYWTAVEKTAWSSINYISLPEYQCAANPNEQNTIFKDVNFVNEAHGDLHLKYVSPNNSIEDYDLIGKTGLTITGDFDLPSGRSTTSPYMGADEATAFTFNGTIRIKAFIDGYKVPGATPVNMTIDIWDSDGSKVYNLLLANQPVTLSTSGTATINCVAAVSPAHGKFHIVLKRPGCLDTWTKNGGENMSTIPGQFLNYDFTNSTSQAYCGNMKSCGCKSFIFNGDIDGDGFIGLLDFDLVQADADAVLCPPFGTGLNPGGSPTNSQPTDLTNDNPLHVSCEDLCLADENMLWFPMSINNPADYGNSYVNRPDGPIPTPFPHTQCILNPDICTCAR